MFRLAKTGMVVAVLLVLGRWISAQEGQLTDPAASNRSGKGFLTMSLGGVEDGAGERFTAQLTPKDAADQPASGGVTIVGLEGISGGAIGDVLAAAVTGIGQRVVLYAVVGYGLSYALAGWNGRPETTLLLRLIEDRLNEARKD